MTRLVQAHVTLHVPDAVTDEMISGWLPSVAAVAEEPVYDHDDSGNERRFPAYDVAVALLDKLSWTEVTEPVDSGGHLVTEIGEVQGVGTEYRLFAMTSPPVDEDAEHTHEFFALIFPPSPVFGKHPKRSQSFTTNGALLAAVGADIDRDLAAEQE